MTDTARESLSASPGSVVIEPYEWRNPNAVYGPAKGTQWLVQVVDENGDLRLLRVCKTRREARRFRV